MDQSYDRVVPGQSHDPFTVEIGLHDTMQDILESPARRPPKSNFRSSIASAEETYSDDDSDSEVESAIPNVRTFVRSEAPQELVKPSSHTTARGVAIEVTVHSVTCCGGGLLKGNLMLQFNPRSKKNRTTQVCKIQLDCIGVECKRNICSRSLCLILQLSKTMTRRCFVMKSHTAAFEESDQVVSVAQDILTSGIYLHDLCKTFLQEEHIRAGQCFVPFELQLPLDVGPGSFTTRDAEVTYTLTTTVGLINGKRFPDGRTMRSFRKVKLYPCLDPQKALMPSSAPIDAVEEAKVRFGGKGTLKVAARIHRAAWIAGQVAYVDVSATNDTARDVNRIQLDLVRHISFYKSAAASSAFRTVDSRIAEKTSTKIVATNVLTIKSEKSDNAEWRGIKAGSRDTTVCQISVPADQLSISAGRYFEARYVIRVSTCTNGGNVELELPITVIHINSLDVIPSAMKSVSRMIATYATPISPQKIGRNDTSSRRTSMPCLREPPVIVYHDRREDILRPVRSTSNRRNPDSHGSPTARRTSMSDKRSLTLIDNTGTPSKDLSSTKPGIQCDLRRALSLDYQSRFSKLDISAETASYTQGAPLAKRSPDRKRRDLSENLAHRLHRERTRNPSFYDVI